MNKSKIYGQIPESKGNCEISTQVYNGSSIAVNICGDPEGLRYMADLLNWLADFDQNTNNGPVGSREHIHLHRDEQLKGESCEVCISRADAKGTGELFDSMR